MWTLTYRHSLSPHLATVLGFIPAPSYTTCEPEPYSSSSHRDDKAALAATTTWHCLLRPRDLPTVPDRESNPHSYLIKGELSPPILCVRSSGLVRLINLAMFELLVRGRARIQTQIGPQMSPGLPALLLSWVCWCSTFTEGTSKEAPCVWEIHCIRVSKKLWYNILSQGPRTRSSFRL